MDPEKRKKYLKEYRSRPEIKERQNVYQRQRYLKNKINEEKIKK